MAQMNEVAARIMEHLCEHDAHGYTQGSRWGNGTTESINVDGQDYYFPGGDRDCSSAVISAYQAAGLDVDATYTGNMRSAFLATGLFEWHGMDFIAQRGDIYLNEGNHTAECTCPDPDLLAEFCIAENGGIYGVEGDQTGFEAYVHGYYDYPWDGILHFIGGEANNDWYIEPNPDVPIPEIPFRVKTENGWLAEDVPGDGTKIKAIAIDMPGWYQVCVMKPDGSKVWVETVSGYNINDDENGYAGWKDYDVIAVRCYYETPNPNETGYFVAKYHAADCGKDYWPWQFDDDNWDGQDGYAGDMVPIDRFEIFASR